MKLINVETTYKPEVALENIVAIKDRSFSDMVSSIAEFFPSLQTSFKGSLDHLSSLKTLPSSLLTSLTNVNSFFSSGKITIDEFKAFNKVKIVVPESFTGNLYDYTNFVKRSNDFLQTKLLPELDIFYARLAAFASNKENKISLLDYSSNYKSLEHDYQELVKESVTYFGKNTHNKRTAELGVTFSDFDQYKNTESTVKTLAKDLSNRQLSQVVDKVKKISNVLDVIVEDAKKKEFSKASYETVKSLATGIFTLAEMIEFYSVTYYRITELAHVMVENRDIFKKLK